MFMNTPTVSKYVTDKPLVTVVTVTHNSALYVREAIESVLAQTYENIEYIIADDHSSDHTWEIIREYEDKRIVAYRNEQNLGEYANRNKALQLASGKYLIFIDGDDLIYPNGIEHFTSQIEKFPQAAFAVQRGYTSNVVYPVMIKPMDVLKNFYFGKFNMLTSSFASNFFNTAILKATGGLSEHFITGDEEVRLRLASKYPVLFIQGWVSWPRETPGQASSRIYDGSGFLETVKITQSIIASNVVEDERMREQILNVMKRNAFYVIKRNIGRGEFRKAGRILALTGFTLRDVIRNVIQKPSFKDPLTEYNPANPLKTKWNERVREKIL
jgi:hypothetical protein